MIPAGVGAYASVGVPFNILSFNGTPTDPDVGYVELLGRDVYLERSEDIEPYSLAFGGLRNVALSTEDASVLISALPHTKMDT